MKYRVMFVTPLGLIPASIDTAHAQPPTPAFNWTGLYVGANIGGLWDHTKINGYQPASTANNYCFGSGANVPNCGGPSQTAGGVLGGLQIGYNLQSGMWVYGIEADINLSSARKTTSGLNTAYAFMGNWSAKTGIDAMATFRGRIGYAFTSNAFAYLTGGVAVARKSDTFLAGSGGPGGYTWTSKYNAAGGIFGGGIEYAVSSNISIKGEALFYDLGKEDRVAQGSFGTVFGARADTTGFIGRVGLNYHFH